MDIGPPELLILLVVLLVVFGGSQLPKLAKNIGSAQKEFKKAMAEGMGESTPTAATAPAAAPQAAATPVDEPAAAGAPVEDGAAETTPDTATA